jgi:hypothetical protein
MPTQKQRGRHDRVIWMGGNAIGVSKGLYPLASGHNQPLTRLFMEFDVLSNS